MLFFIHSRAGRGAEAVEDEAALNEAHWTYMDRFAAGMIARGPTLEADRTTWTGSVHIVDLPSAHAAREFVEHEPYNRAGLFEHHLIRRFGNRLGRTMWDFPGASDDPRFLVIADASAVDLPPERLIVYGELSTPDDAWPAGVVLALHAPSREAVEALLDQQLAVRILDWEFGGRR